MTPLKFVVMMSYQRRTDSTLSVFYHCLAGRETDIMVAVEQPRTQS